MTASCRFEETRIETRHITLNLRRQKKKTEIKAAVPSRVCTAFAALSFVFMLGVAGGIEHDTVSLSVGCPIMLASLGLGTLFAKLAARLR